MPCWPLWPPLSAASTLPSRSRHPRRPLLSSRQRAILRHQVVLALSITIMPNCSSPLSCHCAVHCCPLPLHSRFIAVVLVPSLAVHHRQGVVVPDYFEWCVGVKQLRWVDGVKLPKRGVSPTCVSRFSPEGVGCKEGVEYKAACKDAPGLVLDRNTDRQRALVFSH